VSIDGLTLWWESNVTSVVDYIEKNNLQNRRIIIITDDDEYDITTSENTWRNYWLISSNQISVIKVWKQIKAFPSEFNSILAATNGNVYSYGDERDIESILEKIFVLSEKDENIEIVWCYSLNELWWENNTTKIWAWHIGGKLLAQVRWIDEWKNIGDKQNKLAKKYGIVNQFNSLIALQTISQQNQLDYLSNQNDRFDVVNKHYDAQGFKSKLNNNLFRNSLRMNTVNTWRLNTDIRSSLRGVSTLSQWLDRSIFDEISRIVFLLALFLFTVHWYAVVAFFVKIVGELRKKIPIKK
jgi:hypothetical protein